MIARPVGMLSRDKMRSLEFVDVGFLQHSWFLLFNVKVTSYWRRTHIFCICQKDIASYNWNLRR